MLIVTSISFAQENITVKGNVKSATDKSTLPYVNVIIKGTQTGTTTDFDGNFTLSAPNDAILVISYLGFVTQEVPINNQKTINVILIEDAQQLDEIVVVGYGSQKKSDITGSVTSVKVSEIRSIPLARADQALQGQVSGVQINNNNASPNGNVSIRIRGVSSINGGSDPLVIIDGVQGGQLGDVHPNDIKSIEVLKDASATSIYGSRGSSGVILITTKKGGNNKPTVTYNTFTTIHNVRKKIDLMNAYEYANYVNENRTANGVPVVYTSQEILGYKNNGGTDWQDEIFRTGVTKNHHVSISGGNDNISYNIAGDYLDSKGIVVGSSFNKYSFRPNLSINLNEKLTLRLNSFFSSSVDHPTTLNTRGTQGSPINSALLFSPTKAIFETDGSYTQPGGGAGPVTEYNPVALAKEPIRDNFSRRITINPTLEYQILEDLKLTVSGSYQSSSDESNSYINNKIVTGATRQAFVTNSFWQRYQNTNILSYEKLFKDKHDLKVTGVFEQQKTKSKWNTISSNGFISDATTYKDLSLGKEHLAFSSNDEDSLDSYLLRFNYGFDNKYLLTLTGRYDRASVFAENNKAGFFPSIGLGWNISNESFLKNSKVINNLRLKGSFGEVGNAAIKPYQSLPRLQTGSNFSFDGSTISNGIIVSPQAPNPDLKWETTRQFNVGVDLTMFDRRLDFTADYYVKNTSDLLLERELKQASGFATQLVNAGEVENKGFELALTGKIIQKENFQWNSNVTFSKNKNKIVALNDGEDKIVLPSAVGPAFKQAFTLEVGESIGAIKGVEFDGIWKSNEAVLAAAYGTTPGSPKYIDQNNDGIINSLDNVTIGNALPDFTFGWNNTFNYKDLSLNVLVIGVQGNEIYNIGRYFTESGGRDGTSRALLNAWTPTNENTNIPGHTATLTTGNSSRWIEDGSYIRLKNITLGYNLPKELTESLRVSSIRLYATGTNLFTFTKYTGFDPEANVSNDVGNNGDSYAGVDLATYPSQKRFTLGLDIKF